jgi:hypothetical protein
MFWPCPGADWRLFTPAPSIGKTQKMSFFCYIHPAIFGMYPPSSSAMNKTYAAFAFPVVLVLHLLIKLAFPGWFAYQPTAESDALVLRAAELSYPGVHAGLQAELQTQLQTEPVALPPFP